MNPHHPLPLVGVMRNVGLTNIGVSDMELQVVCLLPGPFMPWLRVPSLSNLKGKRKIEQLKSSQKQADAFKAEALLAFRTITTMLSLLRSTTGSDVPDDVADDKHSPKNSRKTLSILNALAAIVTREHGVGAVVSNLSSENIEVIVSVTQDRNPLIFSQPPFTSVAHLIKEIVFHFTTTQNPRYEMLRGPVISEAAAPKQLVKKSTGDGHELLVAFLMNYW